jgi:hypothetical protein
MAWRFHEHILRGELDNTVRGRVTGRIWLAGVAEPLKLDLRGDCAPDLAGCVLSFENPEPVPMTTRPPAPLQRGFAGLISAARKVRLFDVPLDEALKIFAAGGAPPEHLANALRIEWFNPRCGTFCLESADFRLTVSEPVWRFTPGEIAELERKVSEEATDFDEAVEEDGENGDWDEFRNEQLLRESDAMVERSMRLHELYGYGDEAERIIAHIMGWEKMEDYFRKKSEGGSNPPEDEGNAWDRYVGQDAIDDYEEPEPDPAREGIDWVRHKDEGVVHPIYRAAHALSGDALDEFRGSAQVFEPDADPEAGEFVGQIMTLSVKLAGALNGIAQGRGSFDPSFTIAAVKRVLDYHNATLAALAKLEGKPFITAPRMEHYRAGLFKIREDIIALLARLRAEG